MTARDFLIAVSSAAIGGSGMVGLIFYYIRHYIDKRVAASEADAKQRREMNLRRITIDDKLSHAYGRMFFWLHRAIVTGEHNGDLERAFTDLQAAENEKKNLDREIIAQHGGGD